MATEQRNLFNPKIEALSEKYTDAMGQLAATPFTGAQISAMAPKVAPQTALQQQATQLTGSGIGSYQPFVTAAQQAAGTAGTGLGLAQTGLGIAGQELTGAGNNIRNCRHTINRSTTSSWYSGSNTAGAGQFIGAAGTGLGQAGTTLGGVSPFIGAAGTGLGAAWSFNWYRVQEQEQDHYLLTCHLINHKLIDTTLADFDRQAAQRQQAISDQAVALGGFGGGREGVMQAEYQTGSDRNRAALQAQLQAQGFSQAQAARQADLQNQMALSQGQLGLGQATGSLAAQQAQLAQGQLGLGQAQLGLGSAQAQQAGQSAGMAGQRAALAQSQGRYGWSKRCNGRTTSRSCTRSIRTRTIPTRIRWSIQGFQGTDIARAGQVGAADQAFAQANIDAQREKRKNGTIRTIRKTWILRIRSNRINGWYGTSISIPKPRQCKSISNSSWSRINSWRYLS